MPVLNKEATKGLINLFKKSKIKFPFPLYQQEIPAQTKDSALELNIRV
jgi:hypothetical protein